MLTWRWYGGSHVTSVPWSSIRPEVGCSKPPIIRRVVVLPQPDGPEEAEELALHDLEVDVVDRERVAVRLRDLDEPDVDVVHRWRSLLLRRAGLALRSWAPPGVGRSRPPRAASQRFAR